MRSRRRLQQRCQEHWRRDRLQRAPSRTTPGRAARRCRFAGRPRLQRVRPTPIAPTPGQRRARRRGSKCVAPAPLDSAHAEAARIHRTDPTNPDDTDRGTAQNVDRRVFHHCARTACSSAGTNPTMRASDPYNRRSGDTLGEPRRSGTICCRRVAVFRGARRGAGCLSTLTVEQSPFRVREQDRVPLRQLMVGGSCWPRSSSRSLLSG